MSNIFLQSEDGTIRFASTQEAFDVRKNFENDTSHSTAAEDEMMAAFLKAIMVLRGNKLQAWREMKSLLVQELGLPEDTEFSYSYLRQQFQILDGSSELS